MKFVPSEFSNSAWDFFNFSKEIALNNFQQTIDSENNVVEMRGKGRHDPCVVPRAVPIVEAMAALVLVDSFLINKTIKF